jgi:adenylate cyclase
MFDELVGWLGNNEPVISAFVGLFTLLAGIWGVLGLRMHHRTQSRNLNSTALVRDDSASTSLQRPGVFSTLLNLGLDQQSELEDRISIRTVNIALLALLLINFTWVVTSLFSRHSLYLTVINGAVFIIGLSIYGLQLNGRTEMARWAYFALTAAYWGLIMVIVGSMRSVEYYLPLLLMLTILLFGKRESWKIIIAVGILLLSFAVALYLQTVIPPLTMLDNLPMLDTVAYYLNLALLSITIFLVVNFYNNVAASSFHNLEEQKLRTDELVNSILPEYVAGRIGNQETVVADWHSEATVLIATVVGFDSLSERISAVHLVELLGDVFVQFDDLVKEYGIEKVNTLDTTYVVASGIGESGDPDHRAVAAFALAALKVVRDFSNALGHPLAFRAGISTGQVVSGVIGDARPCFDIWGNTVELANSMRDSAVDNSIVVNEPAYWRLKKYFDFAVIEGMEGNQLLIREKTAS